MPSPGTRLAAPALTALTLALAVATAFVLTGALAPTPSSPVAAAAAPALPVDDFEDGDLDAASGLSWIVIADDQLGGASRGDLESVAVSGGPSHRVLRFHSETAEGFATPFAGTWAAVAEGGQPRDLSRYAGFRFRARSRRGSGGADAGGEAREFLAGVRRGIGRASANYMHAFAAPSTWTEIEIPFAELSQTLPAKPPIAWTAADVGWVGFTTAPGHAGAFDLEIDDVEFYPADGATLPPPRSTKLRLTPPAAVAGFEWQPLASEDAADGKNPRLPDALALAVHHDRRSGLVWFRIDLVRPLDPSGFGVNLAVDDDGDPTDGAAWWGPTNTDFHFDRLVTVWVLRTGVDYQGSVGVADAAAVAEGTFNNLRADGLRVALDDGGRTLFLAVPRSALADAASGSTPRIAATVGSAFLPNDDLPDHGAVLLPAD